MSARARLPQRRPADRCDEIAADFGVIGITQVGPDGAACVHGEVGGVSGACSASQCGENRRNPVYATMGWRLTVDGSSVTDRRDGCFGAGSRLAPDPKRRDVTRRHADQSLTAGRDRQPKSQAKEPVAIQRTKGPETWGAPSGGSSRRPVSRFTGPGCSGDTAAEAHEGRSGWKPRTAFWWQGARGMCVVTVGHRPCATAPCLPSAARACSRPVTAKASSKTGLRPWLKRPATLQSLRHAAGPSLWPALDIPLSAALRKGGAA